MDTATTIITENNMQTALTISLTQFGNRSLYLERTTLAFSLKACRLALFSFMDCVFRWCTASELISAQGENLQEQIVSYIVNISSYIHYR